MGKRTPQPAPRPAGPTPSIPSPFCSSMQHTSTPPGEPQASAPVPSDLVRRYARVVRMSERPGTWHRQVTYPGPFPASRTPLTEHDVAGVRAQRHHIAVRAPDDGLTDRFAFDLDCASDVELPRRDRHYWAIRRIMGEGRVPLVYQTPSGFGLRVVYRVPEMPLERVITGSDVEQVRDGKVKSQGHQRLIQQYRLS